MNPVRKRRLFAALAVVGAGLIAGSFVVKALSSNMTYLYTPIEVLSGEAAEQARFRLGGMVKEGSWQRASDSLVSRFAVSDGDAELVVEYSGILPDLFRENQSVIATGAMQGGVFVATEVLAKHDETYMPREVAEKMEAAHRKHNVDDAAESE